jgi:endonuclease/exonuclease/phosphatase family metal-dependent hydrolase
MNSMHARTLGILGAAALASACASTANYPDPAGPRYSGVYTKASVPRERGLRVVTFNIKYAREAEKAAVLLRDDPRLAGADVITLQEMDEKSTELIARALAVNYLYYPASLHPAAGKNFGNAVLSPWPLEDDVKIVLPHRGRFRKSVRIAVGATMRPPGREPVRVYSVHLETPAGISGRSRRDQAAAILADAKQYPRVIVAGDFNSRSILEQAFAGSGFRWLTRRIGPTISRFSWDHVAVKGFRLRDCGSVGTITNARDVSDHRPVWAELLSDEEARAVAAPECP